MHFCSDKCDSRDNHDSSCMSHRFVIMCTEWWNGKSMYDIVGGRLR